MRSRAASVLAAALAVAGCAGPKVAEPTSAERAGLAQGSTALNGIESACGEVSTSVRVLCPGWLPGGNHNEWGGMQVGTSGRCSYLVTLLGTVVTQEVPFHVMFGGRCRPFSLAITKNRQWPVKPDFTNYLGLIGEPPPREGPARAAIPVHLHVVQETTLRTGKALVVAVASYPNAGIQKGHYAIIWNSEGSGYELSYHYLRGDAGQPPTAADIADLKRGALSMAPLQSRAP